MILGMETSDTFDRLTRVTLSGDSPPLKYSEKLAEKVGLFDWLIITIKNAKPISYNNFKKAEIEIAKLAKVIDECSRRGGAFKFNEIQILNGKIAQIRKTLV